MSNPFLLSAKNSALVSVVDSSANKDVYSYKTAALPTVAHERIEVFPNGGNAGFDQIITFDVPAYGLLSRILFKCTNRYPAGYDGTAVPGTVSINLIDYIEISSQNRVISRQDRNQLLMRLAEFSSEEQANILTAGLSVDTIGAFPLAAFADKTFYLPYLGMISGLQSSLSNVFDTSFTERLQVRVKLASNGVLGTNPPTNVDCSCIFGFTVMKEEDMRSLHLSNYSAQPLIMLNTTSFNENTQEIPAGATTAKVEIACNGVVKKTLIRVNLNDKSDSTNEAIQEVILSGSGRELFRYAGDELRLLGNGNWHHQAPGAGGTGSVYDNIFVIDYTVGKDLPGYSSGAVSFITGVVRT